MPVFLIGFSERKPSCRSGNDSMHCHQNSHVVFHVNFDDLHRRFSCDGKEKDTYVVRIGVGTRMVSVGTVHIDNEKVGHIGAVKYIRNNGCYWWNFDQYHQSQSSQKSHEKSTNFENRPRTIEN